MRVGKREKYKHEKYLETEGVIKREMGCSSVTHLLEASSHSPLHPRLAPISFKVICECVFLGYFFVLFLGQALRQTLFCLENFDNTCYCNSVFQVSLRFLVCYFHFLIYLSGIVKRCLALILFVCGYLFVCLILVFCLVFDVFGDFSCYK